MKESSTVRRVSQRVAPARRRPDSQLAAKAIVPVASPESAAITLRKSEHRFRGLIEKLPVAFYLCDYEGRILLFNECAAKLWGRRPKIGVDSWCGSWKIFRPDYSELRLEDCPMAVALREGRSVRGEEIIVESPDGTRSWVIPHPEPIFDDDGALAGAANVLVDITKQRLTEIKLRGSHDELEQRVRDRTAELSRANEALREKEAFARGALDALRANICVLDESGTIIEVNRSWREFAGANLPTNRKAAPGEFFLGENYLEICDAAAGNEDADAFGAGIRAVIAGQREEFEREYPCHAPAEKRWFNGRVATFPGPGRARVIVAHSNVTNRKLAEESLRRAHESLSLAQSASGSGMFDWDAAEKQLFASPEFRTLFGFPADEPVTMEKWMDLIHPDDRERAAKAISELFESGRDFKLEYRLQLPGAPERWIESSGTLTRDSEGKPARFMGIAMDITDRKVAEERIRWKAELLQLSHDAIAVWNPKGKVRYWNKGCMDLYGYEREEAVGRPIHELLETGFPFPKSFVEAELQRTGRWTGELHQKTKAGTEVIVAARLQIISQTGKSFLVLGTHRDVTQQRRLEQGILDATLREQQRIAQDLHDSICQELSGTEMLTRVLKIKIGPNAAALSDLERISSNLSETIAHTRMLAQGLSPVNLGAKGLMAAIEELAGHTRQIFHADCRYTREQPVLVPDRARATHLYRIVQEAISNALRHGRAKKIRIRLTQSGNTAILAIHDDGIGIPLEVASMTGMGLHTMRHRAETIGGTLQVRRGGVKGTVVVCTFQPDLGVPNEESECSATE